MKVRCIGNTGADLSEETRIKVHCNENYEFDIKKGSIYRVYAISVWENIVNYLIKGEEHNYPDWYPAELFEIVDHLLPLDWYFKYFGGSYLQALWGYKELVLDEHHYEDLIERYSDAIEIFLKRKKEVDSYLNY